MAKKRHAVTLSSLMAIAILAVVSIGPATGQTNQLPTAEVAANPTTGAVGDWFLFDGTASVDPDGTIATITWDFGDGSVPVKDKTMAEAGVIFHTFPADGTYTVTLTVTDNTGATNDPADPKSTIVITIGTGTTTTTTAPPPTTTTTAPATSPDGAALFTTTCSVCHTQANLAGRGLSNAQIVTVMTSGLMTTQASSLSSAEIQAVADYIVPAAGGATTTTSPSATTTTAAPAGASASSLFTTTCSACHTKANITDRGLSSAQITSAMTSGIMKAQASSLSSSQIQAVAGYLAASGSSTGETTTTAAPAGASGASLFASTCSACHSKANITDRGLSSAQITSAMTSGIMTSQASSLSSTQIQAVAAYLTSSGSGDATSDTAATDTAAATFTVSPEAAGLYDANCAACHGTSGEGGVGPSLKDTAYNFDATVAVISNGVGSMPGFSSGLTEDQIKDIAAYSVGFGGGTAGTETTAVGELPTGEGADIYAASCAACHGAKGEGASASPINVPFANDQLMEIIRVGIGDMPGFATTLSDEQVTVLAEYVHALAAMSVPPVTEAPPSEDYIVAIQPSKYVEFDTERSSVPLEPTARLAFALGTLAVLAGLTYWEIQRARKGTGVAGSGGTSPSGSA